MKNIEIGEIQPQKKTSGSEKSPVIYRRLEAVASYFSQVIANHKDI